MLFLILFCVAVWGIWAVTSFQNHKDAKIKEKLEAKKRASLSKKTKIDFTTLTEGKEYE